MNSVTTETKNPLGYESIGRLIGKFALPCVISLIVNALYNIVDQIFIGRGVGYLGNGATNVVFPITVITLAIALLIGDGGAAYLSLKLGEDKPEEARRGVGNTITMAFVLAIVLFLKETKKMNSQKASTRSFFVRI
ncbi:Na+-driven multidrug efflux pump [Lachnospiraceae bacterium PF1-21]|uniref:MATE family efflux transporter n=1 Tax=Ohessyouella blattaphilus TaxID=2949333 RepID=UPI003E1EEC1C